VSKASRSIDELADDLGDADTNVRALALGELVRRGSAATPALLRVLAHADVEVRAQAAQALGEIADPANADVFAGMLRDTDARIRARGAYGLARLGDPRALDALVRTIDDLEDIEHVSGSLSSYVLAGMGPEALHAVAPLLSAPRAFTRLRAFNVIQQIVSRLRGADELQARWCDFGKYDPMSESAERETAVQQWRDWIAREFPP
jgi:HEAT repeat protein